VESDQLYYIKDKLPDILEKGFILPASPDWKIDKFINNETFYFSAQRTFGSINDLQSDYYKKSQFNGASQNFVSFDADTYKNYTDYEYLEIFRDSADIITFTNSFYTYLDLNRKEIAQNLYDKVHDYNEHFNINDAMDVTDLFVDKTNRFRKLVNRFKIIGPHELEMINNEISSINEEIRVGQFIDYLNNEKQATNKSKLIKLFKLEKVELNKKDRQHLLESLKDVVKEEFRRIAIANNIDPLGAYFTSLDNLNYYEFEYTLRMPGVITNSNGNKIDKNTVRWEFVPEDFFNHDYVIIAKSYFEPSSDNNDDE
jgi:hypothetical protein